MPLTRGDALPGLAIFVSWHPPGTSHLRYGSTPFTYFTIDCIRKSMPAKCPSGFFADSFAGGRTCGRAPGAGEADAAHLHRDGHPSAFSRSTTGGRRDAH